MQLFPKQEEKATKDRKSISFEIWCPGILTRQSLSYWFKERPGKVLSTDLIVLILKTLGIYQCFQQDKIDTKAERFWVV